MGRVDRQSRVYRTAKGPRGNAGLFICLPYSAEASFSSCGFSSSESAVSPPYNGTWAGMPISSFLPDEASSGPHLSSCGPFWSDAGLVASAGLFSVPDIGFICYSFRHRDHAVINITGDKIKSVNGKNQFVAALCIFGLISFSPCIPMIKKPRGLPQGLSQDDTLSSCEY